MGRIETFISSSLEETKKIAFNFAKKLTKDSIVVFFADLGAGKTTFIKYLIESLNENIEVTSPTFTYLNIYKTPNLIYHFDLYRIKDKNQFQALGFDEYFSKKNICLIEWAEKISDLLPKNVIKIKINHLPGNKREIICEF